MNKGYQAEDIVRYMSKLDEAGMLYILNFLGGLGGHGYGLSHAQKSAEVINQLHPTMVYASELTLFPDTPLFRDVEKGTFMEATEEERMVEMRDFIRLLTVPTVFKAEHVTIPVPVRGRIPKDKEKMISLLDRLIVLAQDGRMDHFRSSVAGL